MGEPQGRKRKFKKANTKSNNNNKVKDEEISEDVNENETSKVNSETPANVNENNAEPESKKAKIMKFVEMSNKESLSKSDLSKPKKKKAKKNKAAAAKSEEINNKSETNLLVSPKPKGGSESMIDRYPILKDEELIKRFLAVKMSNNQKGRIRVALRDSLKGTSDAMLPEVIHTRIQAILNTPEQSESDMRKLRILHNMLRTAVQEPVNKEKPAKKEKKKKVKKVKKAEEKTGEEQKDDTDDKKKPEQKVKGPKRYVVFIGNLPLDISEDKISEHFSDLSGQIKDVRIPKPLEGKKSAIAYLELKDEVSFELALSKHHSMLNNKRINVLYSTQQNSKITKAEAKGKAAKLVAMQKSGQLAGSVPLSKKRSARRKKMKLAQKKAQEAMEQGV